MNPVVEKQSAGTRRFPRWLRVLCWVGVWIVTLCALAIVVENWLGARAWRAYVAETRAEGESLEPAAVIPPPVPDEENFAAIPLFQPLFDYELAPASPKELFRQAVWRDPAGKERLDKLQLPGSSSFSPPGSWRLGEFIDLGAWAKHLSTNKAVAASPSDAGAEVLLALAKFEPEMNALRVAASRPLARFPIHYEEHVSALLPHIGVLRAFTRIAQARAIAELSIGDTDAAHKDLLLGLRLAESISEEPMLISQLVRVAQLESMMSPLWEGLARHQWKDAHLAAFEAALARCDLISGYQRAMRGERSLFGVQALDAIKKRPQLLNALVNPAGDTSPTTAAQVLTALLPVGWVDFNKANLGRYNGRLLKMADPAAHRFFPDAAAQLETEYRRQSIDRWNPHKLFAALALSAVISTQERLAAMQATVDLARCAVALERHRLMHGALPDTLEALTPTKMPHDVMNGQRLTFRRTGESFVLYSVGWNGRDDAGQYAWKSNAKPPRIDWREGDWPWPQPANPAE